MTGIYSAHDAIIGVQSALGGRGGGASFVGAYDAIPSIVAAYGMRRLLASYTGALVRLRRASDNAESDFGYDANGDLDVAAIATWLTATTGYAVTWYDQSGNSKNVTQSTAANQPLYVASSQNGLPVLRWDGSNDGLATSDELSLPTLSAMIAWDGDGSNMRLLDHRGLGVFGVTQGWQIKNRQSGEDLIVADDGAGHYRAVNDTGTISAASHITTMTYSSGSIAAYIDGSAYGTEDSTGAASGTMGSIAKTTPLRIGKEAGGTTSQIFSGDVFEVIIANAVWSTGDRNAARVAMNAYWSIF